MEKIKIVDSIMGSGKSQMAIQMMNEDVESDFIYISPFLVNYFKGKDISINQDVYALSEMLQWIFRSRIRNDESIFLYVPSKRIRKLFLNWLDNKLPTIK